MTTGYSGTPLARKLGIKEGAVVVVVNAPADFADLLGTLPAGVELSAEDGAEFEKLARTPGQIDILHIFANSRDVLFRTLAMVRGLIRQDGAIWVSWYKKAAKLPTEITEGVVREAALPLGLVDVKVCAIDEKWSGLKLVIRRENRV
jgi:hypothetical protein